MVIENMVLQSSSTSLSVYHLYLLPVPCLGAFSASSVFLVGALLLPALDIAAGAVDGGGGKASSTSCSSSSSSLSE